MAAIVDVDAATGKATAIRRIMLDEAALAAMLPPAPVKGQVAVRGLTGCPFDCLFFLGEFPI